MGKAASEIYNPYKASTKVSTEVTAHGNILANSQQTDSLLIVLHVLAEICLKKQFNLLRLKPNKTICFLSDNNTP